MSQSYQDLKPILEKLTSIVSRHTHDLNRISQVFPKLPDDHQDQQPVNQALVSLTLITTIVGNSKHAVSFNFKRVSRKRMMRKPHYIALSLTLGLTVSSLMGIGSAAVLAQDSPSPAIASPPPSPSPSSSPLPSLSPGIPQPIAEAVNNLEKAEQEFGRSLENYLNLLAAIAKINSSTDATVDAGSSDSESPDYQEIRTKLDNVENASKALSSKPSELSNNSTSNANISKSFELIEGAINEMETQVLSPFRSKEKDTGKTGAASKTAVEKIQQNLELSEPDIKLGVYDEATHQKMAAFLNDKRDVLKKQVAAIKQELQKPPLQQKPDPLPKDWKQQVVSVAASSITLGQAAGILLVLELVKLVPKLFKRKGSINKHVEGQPPNHYSTGDRSSGLTQIECQEVEEIVRTKSNQTVNPSYSSGNISNNHLIEEIKQLKKQLNSCQDRLEHLESQGAPRVMNPRGSSLGTDHNSIFSQQTLTTPKSQEPGSKLTPVATVTLTEESLKSLWQDRGKDIILIEKPDGIFQVVQNDHDSRLYIEIRGRLNRNNLNIVKGLYDLPPGDPDLPTSFQVLKYPIVTRIEGGWKLFERGKLSFGPG